MKTIKKMFALLLLISVSQIFAAGPTSYEFFLGANKVNMTADSVWVEDANWNKIAILRLEDTSPIFFSSVFNALKDFCNTQKTRCWIFYDLFTRPDKTTYNKIEQVTVQ
jgi:hypothetical protein